MIIYLTRDKIKNACKSFEMNVKYQCLKKPSKSCRLTIRSDFTSNMNSVWMTVRRSLSNLHNNKTNYAFKDIIVV